MKATPLSHTNTSAMNAAQLAFAIAALIGYGNVSDLQNALECLIGVQEAHAAIMTAKAIMDATAI